MMKNSGLVLLALGVGLCAAFGAHLSPEMRGASIPAGRAAVRTAIAAEAHQAYCDARASAHLQDADGCRRDEIGATSPGSVATYDQALAQERARVDELRRSDERLGDVPLAARRAWVAALEAAVEPRARAMVPPPVEPAVRLASWSAESGVAFCFGLLLVVLGATMGRIGARREALSDSGAAEGDSPPRDLGALLGELERAVGGLADEVQAIAAPQDLDFARVKREIESIQTDRFVPVVSARMKLQARYGMTGYAAVFGPLSSAERRVNRAWSALVDGHWPETTASLRRASEDLPLATAALGQLASAEGQ